MSLLRKEILSEAALNVSIETGADEEVVLQVLEGTLGSFFDIMAYYDGDIRDYSY